MRNISNDSERQVYQ
jgi:hypothetical protein